MKPPVLIIDDDEDIRAQMKWALAEDYEACFGEDHASAVQAFKRHRPSVVLLDLGLPPHPGNPQEGFAVLDDILALDSLAKVVVITGQSDRKNALMAIERGAYHFVSKPVEKGEIRIIVKHAFEKTRLEKENRELQSRLPQDSGSFEGMLGTSPLMQEVFATIRKVATSDAPVLILGESGTGKEMAALAIHRRSARKDGPFVAINCAAIPENLLESELFGHEKGSFTGAHVQRQGRIEMAANGTLLLDEIGDLPLQLQVKLLRFLQEQTIERVGGRKTIPVDVRVVAATNSDIAQAIAAGKFREDLYYRLAVVVIKVPPLRDRPGDIPVLARAFLRQCALQQHKEDCKFSPQAAFALQQHNWLGNVRELENRVKRAVIMADDRQITPADLELAASGPVRTLKGAREEVERQMVTSALYRHNGKIAPAAADLGISRPTFYELMEKLGVQRPEDNGGADKPVDRSG